MEEGKEVEEEMSDTRILVNEGGARLDLFLSRRFDGYSRAYFKDLIKRKLVKVDGTHRAPDYRLHGGEIVVLQMGEPELLSEQEMEDVLHRFWTYGDNAQKVEDQKRRKPRKTWKSGITYPKRSTFYKLPEEKENL